MKETAIEWLLEELNNGRHLTDELINKAKEMEKEQIIGAHLTGLIYPLEMEATKQAEQYYNETFKD
jgi:hypothetical protein